PAPQIHQPGPAARGIHSPARRRGNGPGRPDGYSVLQRRHHGEACLGGARARAARARRCAGAGLPRVQLFAGAGAEEHSGLGLARAQQRVAGRQAGRHSWCGRRHGHVARAVPPAS
ncbi:hypothetical protein COLO4_01072, partial [Corchorus olitorius]